MSYKCSALILSCIDFRFQEAIHALGNDLRIDGSYDHLAITGAALNITRPVNEQDREFILNQIKKSYELHDISKIIIINHQDCGAYEEFDSETTEKVQHFADLKKAAKIIQDYFSDLKFKLYFAHLKEKGSKREIEFEEVK